MRLEDMAEIFSWLPLCSLTMLLQHLAIDLRYFAVCFDFLLLLYLACFCHPTTLALFATFDATPGYGSAHRI